MTAPLSRRRRRSAEIPRIDVGAILDAPISGTTADGRPRLLSPFEVAVRKVLRKALKERDGRAVLQFLKLCEDHGLVLPPLPPPGDRGIICAGFDTHGDWEEFTAKLSYYGHPPPWPNEAPDRWTHVLREPPEGWS